MGPEAGTHETNKSLRRISIHRDEENPTPGTPSTVPWNSFTGQSGQQIPDIDTYDQCGQPINLYNFANLGKPILLLSMSPLYSPCTALMEWLVGMDPGSGYENDYPNVLDNYSAGKFFIIVNVWDTPAPNWATDYFEETIPVLYGTDVPVLDESGMTGMWAISESMIILYDTWEVDGFAPLTYVNSL